MMLADSLRRQPVQHVIRCIKMLASMNQNFPGLDPA